MYPLPSRVLRGAALPFAAALLLSACGGGGGGTPTPDPLEPSTAVLAQKGPFLAGANIAAYPLAPDGSIPSDPHFSSPLLETGSVQISLPWEGPTLLEVDGLFFDELRGVPSTQPARLRSVFDARSEDTGPINVNLFTHLVAGRVLSLLSQGVGFRAAMNQAREEIRRLFDLTLADGIGPGSLDLGEGTGPYAGDNAQLLYFSGLVLSTGSVEIVNNLAEEFATTGQMAAGLAALAPYRATVDLESLADHLETLDGVTDAPRGDDLATVTPPWIAEANIPVALPDTYTVAEDGGVNGNLAANDTGLGDGGIVYRLTQPPAHGEASVTPEGGFTYTPAPEFNGGDAFGYTVTDRDGDSDQGQVTLYITPVSDLPRALPDAYVLAEDGNIAGDLAANDTGLGDGGIVYRLTQPPAHGEASVSPEGGFAYIPAPEYAGSDTFGYAITDADGDRAEASVTLTIEPVNDRPSALPDAYTLVEDSTVSGDLAANDTGLGDGGIVYRLTQPPAHGEASVTPEGGFAYTPAPEFNGGDAFGYTVTDRDGDSDQGQVTLDMTPVNDAPVARFDVLSTNEDEPLQIELFSDVLANDGDVDGEPLSIHSVQRRTAEGGTVQDAGGDAWFYRPARDFWGLDSFDYTISDNAGEQAVATITVFVLPVNDHPQSNPDGATVREGLSITLDVLENDVGLGDGLRDFRTSKPARGRLTVNPDESVTYIADFGFFGEDSFTYTIEDADGDMSVGGVTITVQCADCGSATLSWETPTKRLDGSELTDLAGYKVYLGAKSGKHVELTQIDDPEATSYVVPDLRPGKYYFVVTAFTAEELESPPSNEVSKGIPCAKFSDPDFPGKPEPPSCDPDTNSGP
jgi:hypothetical protein